MVRIGLRFWTLAPGGLQAVEIVWANAGDCRILAREFLVENEEYRIVCELPAAGLRLVDLVCRFDYVFPLRPPDLRRAAAMLYGVDVSDGTGWRPALLPGTAG